MTPPTTDRPRSDVHRRIAAAVAADSRAAAQWARYLKIGRSAMNHRLTGRTCWSLDDALEVAFRLGTTVDALRDGSYLATKQREDREKERRELLRRLEKESAARRGRRFTTER